MKKLFPALLLALAGWISSTILAAEAEKKDSAKDSGSAKSQLETLVKKINVKLSEEKSPRTETALAGELKEFDALMASHKGEKTDDVAQILWMQAMLYSEVLGNTTKGGELMESLLKEFPDSKAAQMAQRKIDLQKIQSKLAVGNEFPDFNQKDVDGHPLSIGKFKGKVVLVDFWATWCGPCVAELPNVLEAYKRFHGKGFEIVGISLDQKEKALRDFVKKHDMPWQQYFDGKGWQNELAGVYGINSIPATYLIDKEGKIAARDLRGEALAEKLEKMLGK